MLMKTPRIRVQGESIIRCGLNWVQKCWPKTMLVLRPFRRYLVNRTHIPVILCLDEEFFYHVHVSGPNISVQTSPKSRGGNEICYFL